MVPILGSSCDDQMRSRTQKVLNEPGTKSSTAAATIAVISKVSDYLVLTP